MFTTKRPCERKLWAMVLDRSTICSLLRWLAKCCLVLTMVSCLGSSESPESLPSPAIQKLQHESSKVSNRNWLFHVEPFFWSFWRRSLIFRGTLWNFFSRKCWKPWKMIFLHSYDHVIWTTVPFEISKSFWRKSWDHRTIPTGRF